MLKRTTSSISLEKSDTPSPPHLITFHCPYIHRLFRCSIYRHLRLHLSHFLYILSSHQRPFSATHLSFTLPLKTSQACPHFSKSNSSQPSQHVWRYRNPLQSHHHRRHSFRRSLLLAKGRGALLYPQERCHSSPELASDSSLPASSSSILRARSQWHTSTSAEVLHHLSPAFSTTAHRVLLQRYIEYGNSH